jgi:hypothetical protein
MRMPVPAIMPDTMVSRVQRMRILVAYAASPMSGSLIVDGNAIVNRPSSRQIGRAIILEAGLSRSLQPMSSSLLVRIKTVLPALLVCVQPMLPTSLICI